MEINQIQGEIRRFAEERDWGQFHTPRNLLLALVGETGELAELVQWKSDDEVLEAMNDPQYRTAIEDELADVANYLLRLSDVLQVDLEIAIVAKLAKNAEKYPAEQVRGSYKKYNEYEKP